MDPKIWEKTQKAGKSCPELVKRFIDDFLETNKNKQDFKGWKVVSFESRRKGFEPRGVVDIVAIRKDQKTSLEKRKYHYALLQPGDLFEIILIGVRGGISQEPIKPSPEEIRRLEEVGIYYDAKKIIRATCKMNEKGEGTPEFFELHQPWNDKDFKKKLDTWDPVKDLKDIFR